MEEKKTILDYISHVLSIYGFAMICMAGFTKIFGKVASGYALFSLGDKAVSVEVMFQFLLLSMIQMFLRYLFFSDRMIRKLSVMKRSALMIAMVFISCSLFIIIFNWFPIDLWQAWVMFVICFVISLGGSMILTHIKNNEENKKLEEGLINLQKQWEDHDGK